MTRRGEKVSKERTLTKEERELFTKEKNKLAELRGAYIVAYRAEDRKKILPGRKLKTFDAENAYIAKHPDSILARTRKAYDEGKKAYRAFLDRLYSDERHVADFYYAEALSQELVEKKRGRVANFLMGTMKAGVKFVVEKFNESTLYKAIIIGVVVAALIALGTFYAGVAAAIGTMNLIGAIGAGLTFGLGVRLYAGHLSKKDIRKKIRDAGLEGQMTEDDLYKTAEDLRKQQSQNFYTSIVFGVIAGAMVRTGIAESVLENLQGESLVVQAKEYVVGAFRKFADVVTQPLHHVGSGSPTGGGIEIASSAKAATASTVATQSPGQSQLVGGRPMQPVRAGATELAYDFQNDPITVRAYYAKEESYTIIQNIWPSLMQAKQDMLNKLDALLADGVDTMRDQALKARYLANLQAFDDLCQKIIYRMDTLEMLSKAGDMFVNDPAEYAKTYRFHGWPPPDEMQRLMAGRAQMVQELEQMNRQAHDLDKVIKQDMQTIKSLPVLKRGAALLSGEAAQGDSSFVNASHDARDTGHFVPLSLETLTVDQILDKCDAISAATTTEQFNIGKIIASLHDFESRFISTRSSSVAWTAVFEGDYKKLLGLEAKLDDVSQQYADLGGRAEDVATALREEEITKEEAARQFAEIQKDMNALHAKRDLLLGQIEDTKKSIASKVKLPPPGADGNGPETAPHKRDDGVGKELVYGQNDGDASFQTLASTDEPRLRGAQPDDNSYQNDPYRGGTGPKPHELSPDELLAVRQAAWQQFAEIRDQYYASFPKGLQSLVESLMGLPNGRGTAQAINGTIQAINRKMDVYAHAIEDALKHVKGANTVEASAEVREILNQMRHDPELAALVRRLYALQAEGSDIVDTFTRGPKVIPAVYDGTDGAPFELVSQKTNNINPDIGKMRITPENADTIGRIGNMGVGDIDSVQTYQEFLNQQNQKVQASLATLLRRIAALKAIAGTSAATSPQELALLQAQVEVVSSKVGEQVAKSVTGVLENDTFMDLQLGPSNLQREAARMVNELWKPIFALDAKLNSIDAALKAEGIQRTITPPPGTIGA